MSVLVAATFLLVPARALFFKISPNARECFGVDAKSGDDIVFSFEAIGSDRSVRTSLSFKEQELYSEIKASGNQRITAAEDGQYRLCFKSLLSYVQTISFNVRAQKQETHPEELATLDDSKKLEALVAALEGKVQEISAQQSYATTREAVHRDSKPMHCMPPSAYAMCVCVSIRDDQQPHPMVDLPRGGCVGGAGGFSDLLPQVILRSQTARLMNKGR